MPRACKTFCLEPGCNRLVDRGRCSEHQRERQRAVNARRRSGGPRPYDKRAWRDKLRPWVLAHNPICQWPGCRQVANEVDHVVPLAKGGDNSIGNLRALCKHHHSRKTATTDGGFGRKRSN